MSNLQVFIIRDVLSKKMVSNGYAGAAFEGEDGKIRAYELVDIHNTLWPNKLWYVSEETDD
jgi:hypothetical protein